MSEQVAAARVAIVNRALLKLGQPASYSVSGETTLGAIADMAWLAAEAEAMALHDWTFARDTRLLTRLEATPQNGWAYGFALPGDRVGEPLAYLRQVSPNEAFLRDFMVEAGAVFCNVHMLWARIRVMQNPLYWDAGFAEAFATGLAAAMAVPLLQDEDREAMLRMLAFGRPQELGGGGLFGRLITLNRNAQPMGRKLYDNDPLTSARWL
jgi:hypothetical protein